MGCDYCDKIKGLGPKKALKLIQKHHTIENVVLHINRQVQLVVYVVLSCILLYRWEWTEKIIFTVLQIYPVPQSWKYQEARKIFLDVPQTAAPELLWSEPDEEALVQFLCHDRHIK